jgi:hypothetical protein
VLVKKLFKILSLLRLFRELRHALRSHHRGHRPPVHHYRGGHWQPRSRDYYPLYGRSYGKPRMKHLVRELLGGRRH